jgi:hypothetical protein
MSGASAGFDGVANGKFVRGNASQSKFNRKDLTGSSKTLANRGCRLVIIFQTEGFQMNMRKMRTPLSMLTPLKRLRKIWKK